MDARQEIVVVGDEDAVFGLGLIGLRGYAVHDMEGARAALRQALADPATALVLLTENWSAARDEVSAGGAALVIEIPCAGGSALKAMNFEETIERALGVHLESV